MTSFIVPAYCAPHPQDENAGLIKNRERSGNDI
jgi:hypothetical protein